MSAELNDKMYELGATWLDEIVDKELNMKAILDSFKPHPHHHPFDRPTWDQYNMTFAVKAAERSHDSETKVGCYLASRDHKPLSIGYNGHMSDTDETVFPNVRPYKYPFMIHAEMNAIFNCDNLSKLKNAVAYITGQPCNPCLQALWQVGIREVVYTHKEFAMVNNDKEFDEVRATILKAARGRLKLRQITI